MIRLLVEFDALDTPADRGWHRQSLDQGAFEGDSLCQVEKIVAVFLNHLTEVFLSVHRSRFQCLSCSLGHEDILIIASSVFPCGEQDFQMHIGQASECVAVFLAGSSVFVIVGFCPGNFLDGCKGHLVHGITIELVAPSAEVYNAQTPAAFFGDRYASGERLYLRCITYRFLLSPNRARKRALLR